MAQSEAFGGRLSVVVPAYNVEEYISYSLRSLSDQKVPVHEVIVVDDGSTDRTVDVIRGTASAHQLPGFLLIEQANAGVSVARNVGLQRASGDYVLFLDSDDTVCTELVATILGVARTRAKQPDIIHWKFHEQRYERLTNSTGDDRWAEGLPDWSTGPQTLRRLIVDRTQPISVIAAAYRREFLIENELEFTPGCRSGEDSEFHWKTLGVAQAVQYVNSTLSTYVWRQESVTNSLSLKLFDAVLAYDRGAKFLDLVLDSGDRDVALAASRKVVPRFMDIFVEYCRQFPDGGIALLADIKRCHPSLVPIVRRRIRNDQKWGAVDGKWRLFRLSPTLAALYFASSWSQSDPPGVPGLLLRVVRRFRHRDRRVA